MIISATELGKRYNRDWIFRKFSFEFHPGKSYAITGSNGSGKSTLLQVLAGAIMHSEGTITYSEESKNIEATYQQLAIVAPYLELIEELTAAEFLKFHSAFKSLEFPIADILSRVGLTSAANKQIRYYSSGMKQRLKMAQAFFSSAAIILLDEPTTNLDADGILVYKNLIKSYTQNKLVIISSNDPMEYDFCESVIAIGDYK